MCDAANDQFNPNSGVVGYEFTPLDHSLENTTWGYHAILIIIASPESTFRESVATRGLKFTSRVFQKSDGLTIEFTQADGVLHDNGIIRRFRPHAIDGVSHFT